MGVGATLKHMVAKSELQDTTPSSTAVLGPAVCTKSQLQDTTIGYT